MILKFKNEYIKDWSRKIVFAPNGFGKTTSSKKIYEELEKKEPGSTLIFTRRKMDELLAFNKDTFYFGEESEKRIENKNIKDLLRETKAFKNFVINNYSVTSAINLKKASFYFNTVRSNNLYFSFLLEQNEQIDQPEINKEEVLKLDKELKYDIFKEIPLNIKEIKKTKRNLKKIRINDVFYNCLEKLNLYCEENSLKKCPLCGKNFKDPEKLKKAITRMFNLYEKLDLNDPCDCVEKIYSALYLIYSNSKIEKLKAIFVTDESGNVDFLEKVATLANYSSLCKQHKENMLSIVRNLKVEKETAGEIYDKYHENEKAIIKISKSINKTRMLNFIEKEFINITNLDSSIVVNKDIENLSFSVSIGENSTKHIVAEILSESEAKRLSLAVLRGMIKYGSYKKLILDDPLDSYDDYYMTIVCDYIKTLLTETKLIDFYLFTNNNVALFKLSQLLKCKCIIIYENPDIVFNEQKNVSNFLIEEVSYEEINFINQSEINLLNIYLNTETSSKKNVKTDVDLAYIAFLTTLRNIKTEILMKISSLKMIKSNKRVKRRFEKDIQELIEHCYMHYEPDINKEFSSDSLKVMDVYHLYDFLMKIKNPNIVKFSEDKTILNKKRLKECQKTFDKHSGSKIFNLILKKIVFISELKYDFEKTMIEVSKDKYRFSEEEIRSIVKTNSTGRKIKELRKLNRKHGNIARDFVAECEKIHSIHASMVNEFDHALSLMFPPYLNTRIVDIIKYKNALDKLKLNFMPSLEE